MIVPMQTGISSTSVIRKRLFNQKRNCRIADDADIRDDVVNKFIYTYKEAFSSRNRLRLIQNRSLAIKMCLSAQARGTAPPQGRGILRSGTKFTLRKLRVH